MSTVTFSEDDPHALRGLGGEGGHGSGARTWPGPAPKRIVTGYGFWIFILSDIIMFSAFFATYAVLLGATAGGPTGHQIFDLRNVAIETGLLLASSFTCGMATIAADSRNTIWFQLAMGVTCLLGLGFLALEAREFSEAFHFCARSHRAVLFHHRAHLHVLLDDLIYILHGSAAAFGDAFTAFAVDHVVIATLFVGHGIYNGFHLNKFFLVDSRVFRQILQRPDFRQHVHQLFQRTHLANLL